MRLGILRDLVYPIISRKDVALCVESKHQCTGIYGERNAVFYFLKSRRLLKRDFESHMMEHTSWLAWTCANGTITGAIPVVTRGRDNEALRGFERGRVENDKGPRECGFLARDHRRGHVASPAYVPPWWRKASRRVASLSFNRHPARLAFYNVGDPSILHVMFSVNHRQYPW
jgi:hypothetical protein